MNRAEAKASITLKFHHFLHQTTLKNILAVFMTES